MDVMEQKVVAPVQIHVVYLRVTVGIMKIVLALFYVDRITVTLHILHMQIVAMTQYQVCKVMNF